MTHPYAYADEWHSVNFGHEVYDADEFRTWLNNNQHHHGMRYMSIPCMDSSEYGMHRVYKFEKREDAIEAALLFPPLADVS